MTFSNLTEFYQYLDNLVINGASSDELFASSYLRGFVALSAAKFGDESQPLSVALAEKVTEDVDQARTELSPADRTLVNNYWLELKKSFNA